MSLSDDVEKAKRLLARVEPEKPIQWEVQALELSKDAPPGWEPFAARWAEGESYSCSVIYYRRPKPETEESTDAP